MGNIVTVPPIQVPSAAWGRHLWCALLISCGLGIAGGPAAAADPPKGLLLADGGKARVPVVVSAKASASTKAVAAELAQFLGRIAGATFEVTAGDGTKGIVLGTLAEFPDPALEKPLEVRKEPSTIYSVFLPPVLGWIV